MQQERLSPPSPTETEIREIARLAGIYASAYESEHAQGIRDTCLWVLGQQKRPSLPGNIHLHDGEKTL